MSYFVVRGGELCAEEVALTFIAERFATPCYVYSKAALTAAFRQFAARHNVKARTQLCKYL